MGAHEGPRRAGRNAPGAPLAPSPELVDVITERMVAETPRLFPDLEQRRLQVRVADGQVRARCFLHQVELTDGRSRHRALLKVRHSVPAHRRLDRFEGQRPTLSPERTISDQRAAALEFDGLEQISSFARADERFGVVRPLACVPDQAAILMDLVDHPTLVALVLDTARTRRLSRSSTGSGPPPAAWTNAGAWLRTFHDRFEGPTLPIRNGSAAEVASLYDEYATFLRGRLGSTDFLASLSDAVERRAESWLDARLPSAVGHGDFVVNNLFVDTRGRVAGIDPLPCWKVPRYQDLATLTVGMAVHPLQAASQGMAFDASVLARNERAFLKGYFGDSEVPLVTVRAFQLLVLLDRWADLLSKAVRSGRVKPALHQARVRVASRHYEREGRRLLRALAEERPRRSW